MILHEEASHHEISLSFSDLSIWCYECDSYITHPSLKNLIDVIHTKKFSEPLPPNIADGLRAMGFQVNQAEIPKEEKGVKSEEKGAKSEKKEDSVAPSEENQEEEEIKGSEIANELKDLDVAEIEKLIENLNILQSKSEIPSASVASAQALDELSIEGVARGIKSGKFINIITMCGAGISVSAGIPDFRTPGTGLYDNLQKYNLPYPEAIFEIGYFKKNPKPFFTLAKELYPGNFKPTPTHYFIKLLQEKGKLLRCYTQNIDTLEFVSGIQPSKLIEAHGSFSKAHCLSCNMEYTGASIRQTVFADKVPECTKCKKGTIKPDIVFFGENLPVRFFESSQEDFKHCDLLLILGTSLKVQPFAGLVNKVTKNTPRVLINREKAGASSTPLLENLLGMGGGLAFDSPSNTRDVFIQGDCDDGVKKLAALIGWQEDLNALMTSASASTTTTSKS